MRNVGSSIHHSSIPVTAKITIRQSGSWSIYKTHRVVNNTYTSEWLNSYQHTYGWTFPYSLMQYPGGTPMDHGCAAFQYTK